MKVTYWPLIDIWMGDVGGIQQRCIETASLLQHEEVRRVCSGRSDENTDQCSRDSGKIPNE